MAQIDDFEIIDEMGFSYEPTFELIDENGAVEKPLSPVTPPRADPVLPLLIPKPLIEEIPQVLEPEPVLVTVPASPPVTTFTPIKQTIIQPPPTPRIFAPVPLLPKAPPLKRFGVAAIIPQSINAPLDIDTVIDKSREKQQATLYISTRQQQQRDIQTILEQRRRIPSKTNF